VLPPATALAQRTNTLFRGTHVVSGRGTALVAATGAQTAFGQVSARLRTRAPENDFERGIRHFGYFLTEITMVLVLLIFAINVYFKRPVLESLLFAVALAVGLTPQLLPAVISINLAYGAKRMATKKVIVKRPDAIENFGSMDVLCSDKTGTLTEGIVTMHSAVGIDGSASERVLLYAYLNASFQTGLADPIDDAVRGYRTLDISAYTKQGEVPYDFVRKRLSVLVAHDGQYVLVTKGAVANVLAVCTTAEVAPGQVVALDAARADIDRRYEEFSGQGCRTLGVAYRPVSGATVSRDDESDLTFMGFIVLFDPPKPGIAQTIADLHALGIALKLITGDNRLVAAQVGREVGLAPTPMLTGLDLAHLSMEALVRQVPAVNIFAEIEPNQKERLLLALRKAGHVVGYIGDGINDAAALHAADVGISVDSAVDVAKEAAAIVLLDKDLSVLATGVREGRVTFANTLKYVFMATSANFGNMFSMAGASLFLSFLPLLPKQILLTNLLTDVPETTICTDSVDAELVARPRRWNIRFIRAFMLTFGLLSSVFDYLTFGVLFWLLHANAVQFRTGWFLESVTSATLIVLVIRSERPFFRSQPSRQLLTATLVIVAITLLLPYTTLARVLGFTALPVQFLVLMALIVALYVAAAETTKHLFYQRMHP
jgi:Mg2+-importing ATPase